MKKIKKVAKSSASAPKPALKAKAKTTKTTSARGTSRTTKKPVPVKPKMRLKKRRVLAAPKPKPKPTPTPTPSPTSTSTSTFTPTQPSALLVVRAPVVTIITAHIDIGFGNTLYLRGEGAGLSWDRGTLMNCVADNCWSLPLPESGRPVIFKFLVNDLSWSAGQDYTVASGDTLATTPMF
jgi:hypothetical protein